MMKIRTYLAIGSWCVLGVAMAGQGFHQKTNVLRRPVRSAEERVDDLQTGFQAALDDLSMTHLHPVPSQDERGNLTTIMASAEFGLSRTPRAAFPHNGVLREAAAPLHGDIQIPDIPYFAVSSLGKPLSKRTLQIHKLVGTFAASDTADQLKQIVAFAGKSLGAVKKQGVYKGEVLGFEAEARPLRLSKPECMPCHGDSKLGDPLAILVCLVKRS